ncbi:hypothetical protein ABPG77_007703 [Micractinium sp. CCAP 211/92]
MGAVSLEPMSPAIPSATAQAVAAPGAQERGRSWPWSAPAGAVSFQPSVQPPPADPSLVRRALQVLEEQDGTASPAGDVPSIQELIDISLGLGLDLRTATGSSAELSLLPPAVPSALARRQLAS